MSAAGPEAALVGWVVHVALALLRVTGLFLFLPIFGADLLPLRLRLGIALVLAAALAPLAPALAPPTIAVTGLLLAGARELLVGLVLGLSARAIFAGVESAAGLIAGQAGFALASMVDPVSGDQALPPTLFQNLLSLALFLAADLHHVFVRAIVSSWELVPPAAALPQLASLDQQGAVMGMRVFALATHLAAPALIVTVSVDLIMALVGRAMPQVPILLVGYPLKMASGLVALALLATTTGGAVGWIGRTVATDATAVIAALGGGR